MNLPLLAKRGSQDPHWFSPYREETGTPFLWPDFNQLGFHYRYAEGSDKTQSEVAIRHQDGKSISIGFGDYVRMACNQHPDLLQVVNRLAALRTDAGFAEAVAVLPELASLVDHAECVMAGKPFDAAGWAGGGS